MITRSARVRNHYGIHCRPSALIAQEAQRVPECTIRVQCNQAEAEGASVLGLVSLGIECGAEVSISVSGPDEELVCDRFVELFETEFDFPR